MLAFKVAAQYGRGPEKFLEGFKKEEEAKKFIHEKLAGDAALKVNVTYLLYDMGELVGSFDQRHHDGNANESSSQQQSSASTHRISPLATTLRPQGMPLTSSKPAEDEKKK